MDYSQTLFLIEEIPNLMRQQRFAFDPELSIRKAAKQCGISPTTYHRVERGYTPDMPTFVSICKWLKSYQ